MAFNEIKRYSRSYGNESRPPLPAPVKVGDTIRVSRLQRATRTFSRKGYTAKVTDVKWGTLPGSSVWQWLISEQHVPDTKKKNGARLKNPRRRMHEMHGMAYTKIELKQKEKSREPLEMYGPECPPFLPKDQVRTSYKHSRYSFGSRTQYWEYGEIAGVNDIRLDPAVDPHYSFNVRRFLERSSGTSYGLKPEFYDFQAADSKRHRA